MEKKVFISGMHSGQNPASGLGIARCLKKAFPDLRLVGADHWQGCTGLHDPTVDEVLLFPQWNHIDDELHAQHVRSILDEGHLWLASMDMEVHWFSENLGTHPNLLAPDESAIELTAKPAVKGLEGTDFRVPDYVSANLPDSDIHGFLRHNSWRCWLKSPYHDARRITSWAVFEKTRELLSKNWRTSKLFLQRHVIGNEETVAFAAYRGELVGAAHLEKRQLTPEGKTWAGRVTPIDDEFQNQLEKLVRRTGWNGGGELEFVRDSDGQKWIIECNPRFPAWIYGGAIAGINLPARLISRIWNMPFLESVGKYPFFTRVVHEIPAKEWVGIPLQRDPGATAWASDGKGAKGGPAVAEYLPRLNDSNGRDADEAEADSSPIASERVPEELFEEVKTLASSFEGETPSRLHLEEWTRSRYRALADRVRASRSLQPSIHIGYSVKTCPTDDHLKKAKAAGFFAECISQKEVRRALDFGFRPDQVILNGPGKFWPLTARPVTGLHMLFSDSIEEFERTLEIHKNEDRMADCLGFRLRIPKITSRFGNSLGEFDNFQRIVHAVRSMKGQAELGFHFHMPSWAIGMQKWLETLKSLLIWCRSVEQLSGTKVKRIDLGGGFFPADLATLDFAAIQEAISVALPGVHSLYFEPGRSLTQESEILVSRVLDVRKNAKEIVVDACIAELPLAQAYPHRVFFRKAAGPDTGCTLLKKGSSRILGRICMEDDILCQQVELPDTVNVGDLVIFGDAGGYERSMSYGFGRG